ncbi:Asp/Glu/hydantoin racemase [Neobacillus drentensis]|nr:Asp/Glu/hydantoin racemase [Neobacillus drentensis]
MHETYNTRIERAKKTADAEYVLLGGGAGLSAAAV